MLKRFPLTKLSKAQLSVAGWQKMNVTLPLETMLLNKLPNPDLLSGT